MAITRDSMGRALRMIRVAKDMTLRGVSEVTGMSSSYISQIENGLRDLPMQSLGKYCDAMGVPPTMAVFMAEDAEDFPAALRDTLLRYSMEFLKEDGGQRDRIVLD